MGQLVLRGHLHRFRKKINVIRKLLPVNNVHLPAVKARSK